MSVLPTNGKTKSREYKVYIKEINDETTQHPNIRGKEKTGTVFIKSRLSKLK